MRRHHIPLGCCYSLDAWHGQDGAEWFATKNDALEDAPLSKPLWASPSVYPDVPAGTLQNPLEA